MYVFILFWSFDSNHGLSSYFYTLRLFFSINIYEILFFNFFILPFPLLLMWLDSQSCLNIFFFPLLTPMSYLLQILRRCGVSVELVDVSDELPQLIRRPGLTKWKVSYHFTKSILGYSILLKFCHVFVIRVEILFLHTFCVLLCAYAFHFASRMQISLIYSASCLNKMFHIYP